MSGFDALILGITKTMFPYFCGWLLFRLIAKQNNPFRRPIEINKRPRWFLALWSGLVMGAVFGTPLIGHVTGDYLGWWLLKTILFILYCIPGLLIYGVLKWRGKGNKKENTSNN